MKLSQRSMKVASAVVATLAMGYMAFRMIFPPTLADHAENILHAMYSGDGSTLFSYSFPDESRLLGLSPSKLTRLYRELIVPRYRRYGNLEIVRKQVNDNRRSPSQGVCEGRLDRGAPLNSVAWQTDDGPKTDVVGALTFAWILDYRISHPEAAISAENNLRAQLEGFDHDKDVLRDIGIDGILNLDSVVNGAPQVDTWDARNARLAKRLSEAPSASR